MLNGGGAPLSERLVRLNQKIDIEEIAALQQKPHVESNQKIEREELTPTMLKPLVGSNQKTEIMKLPPLMLKPLIGSNQETETEKLPPSLLKLLVGSNQNTEMEELPLQLRDRPRSPRPFPNCASPISKRRHPIQYHLRCGTTPSTTAFALIRNPISVTGGRSTTVPLIFSTAPEYTGNPASPF